MISKLMVNKKLQSVHTGGSSVSIKQKL